jgi:hypothetical protein
MLRRALPVLSAAAAALVLVPGSASATPAPAPVENTFGGGYSADVRVVLSDGRHATAWLGEFGGPRQYEPDRELYLTVWSEYTCYEVYTCQGPQASGLATLTAEQLDFSRDLRGASVTDVPVTLQSWSYDPTDGYTSTQESVTVSVVFTGTGEVSRTTEKGELCGDGSRECQSIRISASRGATGTVTLDGRTVSGEGSLSFVQGVDVAAPKFEDPGFN